MLLCSGLTLQGPQLRGKEMQLFLKRLVFRSSCYRMLGYGPPLVCVISRALSADWAGRRLSGTGHEAGRSGACRGARPCIVLQVSVLFGLKQRLTPGRVLFSSLMLYPYALSFTAQLIKSLGICSARCRTLRWTGLNADTHGADACIWAADLGSWGRGELLVRHRSFYAAVRQLLGWNPTSGEVNLTQN